MKGQNWEVGSTWYTLPSDNVYPPNQLNRDNICYLSTCRSAIGAVLDKVCAKGCALVPAFTCHSVILPFTERGMQVFGYPLNEDLLIDWTSFMELVVKHNPSVILIHGYFGFDTTKDTDGHLAALSKQGITVIEDQTQTMFSSFERVNADFRVGSIRKWMPIPDGAFASNVNAGILDEDAELAEAKVLAMDAKRDYIIGGKGVKTEIMPQFGVAEGILDSRKSMYSISKYSREYLEGLDIKKFSTIRRENYALLSSRLQKHEALNVVLPDLKDGVVPFLLPVYVSENRAEFQKFMAKHSVFPTIIWKCSEELEDSINPTTRMIYESIICFHIDQRYDNSDMEKVADIVDSYFKQNDVCKIID